MKKLIAVLISAVLASSAALAVFAGEIEPAGSKIFLNGEELIFDTAVMIQDDRTLVPMRAVFEALGAEVKWDGTNQTITASKGGTVMLLTIGGATCQINGESVPLDVPPVLYGERTLVPLRFVSETLDLRVEYDGETNRIFIMDRKPIAEGKFLQKDSSYTIGALQDGLPNGLGKTYNKNGKLIYEGEFADGIPAGYGITYDSDGNVQTEGRFAAGMQISYNNSMNETMQGLIPEENETTFTVLNGKKGSPLFEGFITQNGLNGFGILYTEAGTVIYRGEFADMVTSGWGTHYSNNGIPVFEGEGVNTVILNGIVFMEEGEVGLSGKYNIDYRQLLSMPMPPDGNYLIYRDGHRSSFITITKGKITSRIQGYQGKDPGAFDDEAGWQKELEEAEQLYDAQKKRLLAEIAEAESAKNRLEVGTNQPELKQKLIDVMDRCTIICNDQLKRLDEIKVMHLENINHKYGKYGK